MPHPLPTAGQTGRHALPQLAASTRNKANHLASKLDQGQAAYATLEVFGRERLAAILMTAKPSDPTPAHTVEASGTE
jgi:hypothetical protein